MTMTRKATIGLLAVLLTVSFVGAALALELGNDRKGKYTYRKVYSACFDRGEVASKTPPLSPSTKTQAQWTEIFEKGDLSQFGCAQEWGQLAAEDVRDIYTYLHNHASDSPSPATCK